MLFVLCVRVVDAVTEGLNNGNPDLSVAGPRDPPLLFLPPQRLRVACRNDSRAMFTSAFCWSVRIGHV